MSGQCPQIVQQCRVYQAQREEASRLMARRAVLREFEKHYLLATYVPNAGDKLKVR